MALPETEKIVLRNAILAIRLLTKSSSPQIVRAAHKWDATISCFIRKRLINGRRSRRSDDAAVGRLLRGAFTKGTDDVARSSLPISPLTNERSRQGGAGAQD